MKNVTETTFLVLHTNDLPEDIRDDLLDYCPGNDTYVTYWIERPEKFREELNDVDDRLWNYIDGDSQDDDQLTLLLKWGW